MGRNELSCMFKNHLQPLQQHQDPWPAAAFSNLLSVQGEHRAKVGGPQEHSWWLLDSSNQQGPQLKDPAGRLVVERCKSAESAWIARSSSPALVPAYSQVDIT